MSLLQRLKIRHRHKIDIHQLLNQLNALRTSQARATACLTTVVEFMLGACAKQPVQLHKALSHLQKVAVEDLDSFGVRVWQLLFSFI